MTIKVTENTVAQKAPDKIDREAGIIYGVKVCGNRSKNGREYPAKVLEAAIPVYEGVAVYVDHGLMPGDERPLDAHFGSLRNVRVQEGELFADLHYVKNHTAAEAVLERAERFANNFGLSHDAEIESVMESGVQKVTKIVEVASVDLVTRPATNKGIFEHREKEPVKKVKRTYKQVLESLSVKEFRGKHRVLEAAEMADDPMLETPIEMTEEVADAGGTPAMKDAMRQLVVAAFDDESLDFKGTLNAIKEVLKMQEKMLGTEPPAKPTTEEEDGDPKPKEDPVMENEDDPKPEEENATESVKLRREIAELKRRLNKSDTVAHVLESHKITNAPAKLKATLSQFDTKEEMLAYLDGGPEPHSVLESTTFPIHSAVMESEGEAAKTKEEFLSRCYS